MPFFHCFPLIVNIERQRFGNAFTVRQLRLAGNNKAEARYSLNALIGAADKEIDTQLLHIQRYAAKAAHGIYNQFLAVHLYSMGNLLQRIQHPGSGFTMHYRHMRNLRIMRQIIIHIVDRYLLRLIKGQHIVVDAVIFGYISHTVTVGSVT